MALFLLRVVQIGLKIEDLDFLEYGEVLDIFIEEHNDHEEYEQLATQEDYDRF